MALSVMAVVMSASSWNQMLGRSLRQSLDDTPPFWMGISTESPVRLSVMVMESAMSYLGAARGTRLGSALDATSPGGDRRQRVAADGVSHTPSSPGARPRSPFRTLPVAVVGRDGRTAM